MPDSQDYSKTLFLPKTDFPMRARLPHKEPEILSFWRRIALSDKLLAATHLPSKGSSWPRPKFILHDGPPYANGHLHIGHALNKILKDIICRSRQMQGFYAPYVPGWDCHGLPIEWKVEEEYRAKGKNKDDVPINEFRKECREFAQFWVGEQAKEFMRLGVQGDFKKPYTTMAFHSEACIAEELMKFALTGQLYRGSKPVMWSVVERTALAEAEVEYQDYESDAIWAKFPVIFTNSADLKTASVLIWTTTPWTIPGNRAIAYSNHVDYGLYEVTDADAGNWANRGDRFIMADKLAEEVFGKARVKAYKRARPVPASELADIVCRHPLKALGYDFDVPLLAGEHVSDEAGTGFVHTAPGHGLEDFELWMQNVRPLQARGLEVSVPFTVGDDGAFTDEAPGFSGAYVINDKGKKGEANPRVIEALKNEGALVARARFKHQYPHSWRSKKPVIFRNTPQWFVHMDKELGVAGDTLRARALQAIENTWFIPASGQNRLRGMIEHRPDWVLSRQRAWGVPIPVFVNSAGEVLKDKKVNERILEAFEKEGADAWFETEAKARFLGHEHDHDTWQKVTDILDVWFDSGSTHSYVLEDRPELKWPADLYLEGSDQHRGWFHSSLLESCGTRGRAPYEGVLTHGFTMDQEGRKMSKSLGNVIVPQKVIDQYGADILRLWTASVDYTEDQRIGPDILKSTVETYRKLRNTLRWMLGALGHFKAGDKVAYTGMPELERLMLHELFKLDGAVRAGYEAYDFKKVLSDLFRFMTVDLSAFYFDVRKDALYCDPLSSVRRKAALTVIDLLFVYLIKWLAPILPFTCEEAWLYREGMIDSLQNPARDEAQSVHLQLFDTPLPLWENPGLGEKWRKIRQVRRVVTGALEIDRQEKRIGSSLEAAPHVFIEDADLRSLLKTIDFAEVCITSALTLEEGPGPGEAFRLPDAPGVAVQFARAKGQKCARSWKIAPDVGADPDYPDLALRDAKAMRELEAAGFLAAS